MTEKEQLNFKIGISGSYHARKPCYTISVNGIEKAKGVADSDIEYISFDAEVEEGKIHTLDIRLTNKLMQDTVVDENGNIVKDMLLNIDYVSVDDIDLQPLKWSHSQVVADDPERPTLTHCVNLGWNGTWVLKFESPFYIWLLENM